MIIKKEDDKDVSCSACWYSSLFLQGRQPFLLNLLSLYKVFCPELVTLSIPSRMRVCTLTVYTHVLYILLYIDHHPKSREVILCFLLSHRVGLGTTILLGNQRWLLSRRETVPKLPPASARPSQLKTRSTLGKGYGSLFKLSDALLTLYLCLCCSFASQFFVLNVEVWFQKVMTNTSSVQYTFVIHLFDIISLFYCVPSETLPPENAGIEFCSQ